MKHKKHNIPGLNVDNEQQRYPTCTHPQAHQSFPRFPSLTRLEFETLTVYSLLAHNINLYIFSKKQVYNYSICDNK